jgi:hypothetical protein
VKTLRGQRAVVRNGYLPEREVLKAAGPVPVRVPKVRHRTTRTRNCVSRPTFLGLGFKLIEEAEKTWRRINEPETIKLSLEGVPVKTANRCKTIDRLSRNSPFEIDRHEAAHTPLLTLPATNVH